MSEIASRSCVSSSICTVRARAPGHHAASTHVRTATPVHPSASLRRRSRKLQTAHAAEPGDNGVPALDDAEGAPIPLVPEATATSSLGPLLAVGGVAVGAAFFFATRLGAGAVSFDTLASDAMPLSTALANHRPSVIEFYASWCAACLQLELAHSAVFRSVSGTALDSVPSWKMRCFCRVRAFVVTQCAAGARFAANCCQTHWMWSNLTKAR
jgi:hypothetical protein